MSGITDVYWIGRVIVMMASLSLSIMEAVSMVAFTALGDGLNVVRIASLPHSVHMYLCCHHKRSSHHK